MAKKGSFSKVYDKNGDYADVEAVRFDGTRTFQMQGDVTASQTWNGDPSSPLTLNASIGAKKVTQDKIGDKAVGTGQMADGSVGLTQMASSAMTDTVSANNNKLVTSQGVNAAIAAATLNRGKDYGPLSVDEINAISETIPTGSTVYVESLGASDAKVINDGYSDGTMASFSVEVGEDLKYYRSPDNSLHGWYSTEANVKIKQPANYAGGIAVDSAQDASSGSAGIEFIQSFKQDTNGNIRDIVKAQVDIVDSTSSTRTNAAATPNSVKSAYDLANTANTGLVNKLDKTGDGKDVTATFTEASTRESIGTGEKLSVMFGKIKKWFTDLKALAFKDTVSDSDISGSISDSHIASASTWNGKADKVGGATNGNFAALDSNGNLTDSDKKASDFELVTNKVSAWQGTPDNTHYPSEKLVKESLDAKVDVVNIDLDGKTTTILAEVQALAPKGIHYARFYTRGDGGAGNISDKPVSGMGFLCEVVCNRFAGLTNYRYLVTCWVGEDKNPYCTYVKSDAVSITWSRLNAYVPGTPTNNNLVAMDANGLVKDSGVAVLPSTSTWDGTSDAKVPTAKAVQAKLDGKAPLASPALTGTPTAPTAASGTNTTQIATTAFVQNSIGSTYTFTTGVSSKYVLAFTLTASNTDISGQGVIMAFTVRDGNNGNAPGLLYIRKASNGNCTSFAIVDGFSNRDQWSSVVGFYQETVSTTNDISFYVRLSTYSQISLSVVNKGRCGVNWGTDASTSLPESYAAVPTYESIKKPAGSSSDVNSGVGSSSIPVYVDASGAATPCTDTFVNDIAYVANQSGGGGNLNKTINGTTTSVLTFMNDSEAVAIWNDAKTAAANAS